MTWKIAVQFNLYLRSVQNSLISTRIKKEATPTFSYKVLAIGNLPLVIVEQDMMRICKVLLRPVLSSIII